MKREYTVTETNIRDVLSAIQNITNNYKMFRMEKCTTTKLDNSDSNQRAINLRDGDERSKESAFIFSELIEQGGRLTIRLVDSVAAGNGFVIIKPGSKIAFDKFGGFTITTVTLYRNSEDVSNPFCETCVSKFIRNPFAKIRNLDELISNKKHELLMRDARYRSHDTSSDIPERIIPNQSDDDDLEYLFLNQTDGDVE